MAERPILFNTEMVIAILDGRKTQTRRIVKPQPVKDDTFEGPYWYEPTVVNKDGELGPGKPVFGISSTDGEWGIKSPYQPGDRLWVRETWADLRGMGFGNDPITGKPWNVAYKADIEPGSDGDRARIDYGVKWKPSIHMPKSAARIWLEVVGVRVERLQEITEEDARAEGIVDGGCLNCGESEPCGCDNPQPDARDGFIYLWDSINAKRGYGWDTNPWVWVIEFKKVTPCD